MKKIHILMAAAAIVAAMASCNNPEQGAVAADTPATVADTVPATCTVDLPAMEAKSMANFKGGEGEIAMKLFAEGETKVMLCTMPAGSSVGYHSHDTSMEVIRVEQGTATIVYDADTLVYSQGQVHICPKGHSHSISNLSDGELVIYNVVAAQ